MSRPSDHFDSDQPVVQPRLGFVGYLRFFWRQLTSMRTALFLLLLLAIAAIPGSLVPQVSSDPNGVVQYKLEYPDLSKVLDFLQVFTTYSSVWFSAIYLLLFVSLIGCVIPRTKHHLVALLAKPPKTPARLERLAGFTSETSDADAATAVETARDVLRKQGYRVEQYGDSVSAERGYLRETGNLVFHTALIGVLVTVGIGGGFGYTGQKVVVEGKSFVNTLGGYDSFNPGRFFTEAALQPFSLHLDKFTAVYEDKNFNAYGQAIDYTASVTTALRGAAPEKQQIKVNSPLEIGGTQVYLLGNGYAPVLTIRDPDGNIVWSQPTPFLPQDAKLTSLGVIKIPDGLSEQLGMIGFLYPTTIPLQSGALASSHPDLLDPTVTLEVYTGDLGLDDGVARNAYNLDLTNLTQIAGRKAESPTIELGLGDRVDLPGGIGSIELTAIPRFASLDIHHDPSQVWVLVFAILVLGGLLTSLFIPRRRVWVKVVPVKGGGIRLEYAGLARGEDPNLAAAVTEIAQKHADQLSLRLKP
ncbi:MAG: cytochrome c biogenesis protein ResB [Rhodoglobus sp.]